MSKIKDFLTGLKPSNIVGEGIKSTISSVADVVDRFVQSPDEKAKIMLELEKITNERLNAEQANTANAREMNAKIQESANASWLSKNIAYILDIFVVLVFAIMLFVIMNKSVPEANKELFYTAFGGLVSLVTTVFNFHRGSSSGSVHKQSIIDKIKHNATH
jgi:hypothetical protein